MDFLYKTFKNTYVVLKVKLITTKDKYTSSNKNYEIFNK